MAISLKPEHLSRYKDIARLMVRHGRSDLLTVTGLDEIYGDGEDDREDAADLASDLEAMGPTFVKLGQLMSTRADLLPPVYLEELARLQDDVEPVPFDDVRDCVESELGFDIATAFAR